MSDAPPPPPPGPYPPAGGGAPPPSGWSPPGGPWPPQASGYPAAGYPTPTPPRRGLSYWGFLARTVTVAVIAPLVAFGTFVVAMFAVIALIAAAIGGSGTVDDRFPDTTSIGGDRDADDWVLVVDVKGVILSDDSGGLGDSTSGEDVRQALLDAADDGRVGAVVLEMSTPGGTVPGAEAIAAGVEAVRAAGKPVVAHVTDLSASGGMLAMAGADRIIANTGSSVGSIGVIFGPIDRYRQVTGIDGGLLSGGVEAGSIEQTYLTAGRGKDFGNPFRDATPEELARYTAMIDTTYSHFVEHVSTTRKIPAVVIRDQIGAFVYSAEEALGLGLVDAIGSPQDAWSDAARRAGLGTYDVRRLDTGGGLASLLGLEAPPASARYGGLCTAAPSVQLFHGDLTGTCGARR